MEIIAPPKTTIRSSRPDPLGRLNYYYHAARKRAWDVNDLGWHDLPPVPRVEVERWKLIWASVVEQQLQADRFAVEAATDLLLAVPDHEATMYYSTMVVDEARHIEGWSRLSHLLGEVDCHDPYLAEMGQMLLDGETLEERVVAFQVVFEGGAINAFRMIAGAAEKTVLGEMASKLIRDDSIHHNSGVAYAEHLLANASPALKRHVGDVLKRYVPLYKEHLVWRPPVRRWLGRFMASRDRQLIAENQVFINKAVTAIGIAAPFDI